MSCGATRILGGRMFFDLIPDSFGLSTLTQSLF